MLHLYSSEEILGNTLRKYEEILGNVLIRNNRRKIFVTTYFLAVFPRNNNMNFLGIIYNFLGIIIIKCNNTRTIFVTTLIISCQCEDMLQCPCQLLLRVI